MIFNRRNTFFCLFYKKKETNEEIYMLCNKNDATILELTLEMAAWSAIAI